MLKKLLMLCIVVGLSLGAALASAVEVNTADEAALETVKGIGPAHARAIIDERTKNGPFRNADDLVARVKGIGPKSVVNLEAAGLTINGSAAAPTGSKAGKGGKSSAIAGAGTTTTAAAAADTATPSPAATTTADTASSARSAHTRRRGRKNSAAASAASATDAAGASAPTAASSAKTSRSRRGHHGKAASAATASGG
ncbi:competence protein ComE [Burkholderia sp. WAC0059]|uniref:ComEA family DNA-binding protein n=1 Tax=Burkholderia sp. WAC0059 TaxID=2066022 RepID=UPI000C7EDD9B|nr:helix-hairpin-helix domain-containing protein [Burkholderia sp. WAC0059]PLZ03645.1 competence protein ComE [Burkholderia sp. WAC0059]